MNANKYITIAIGIYITITDNYRRYDTSRFWTCRSQTKILEELLVTRKLLIQGFLLVKLKSSFLKFYGRHHDLADRYGISVSQMTTDMFHLS